MRINDFIMQPGQFNLLNPQQEENLIKLIDISKVFHKEAGMSVPKSASISNRTIVLESGHQPNFLPYPGVWKKAFLLDYISKQLRTFGVHVIPVFGFADYNLSTASYLSQNQIPAFNRQGSENIGFKILEKDRWRCFHSLDKPSEERFSAEIEKIRRFYLDNTRNMNSDRDIIVHRTERLMDLLKKSHEQARTYSEMNAIFFSRICTEIFAFDILFFRYTDVQKKGLFVEISRQILNDLKKYNESYNRLISSTKVDIPQIEKDDIPFWYHCECGGKVHLIEHPSTVLAGTCPVCGREHQFSSGSSMIDLDVNYPQMSLNAIARNIIFSQGLGTHIFISGTGGGLRYGLLADAISQELGFHRPLTLAWQSKDYYLGVVHHRSLVELMRTFQLHFGDLTDPSLNVRVREYRATLQRQIAELRERGGARKEIQRLEGRFLNSAVQAAILKKIFSITPSILDLMAACEPNQILEAWVVAVSEAEIDRDDHLLKMHQDVLYPCDLRSPLAPDKIPSIHHAMKAIEVE
jgi:hypothetical protein